MHDSTGKQIMSEVILLGVIGFTWKLLFELHMMLRGFVLNVAESYWKIFSTRKLACCDDLAESYSRIQPRRVSFTQVGSVLSSIYP